MDKEDVLHIHNGISLSHEKNKITPFAIIRMDLEIIVLSEVSQKKTNIIGGTYLQKERQTHRRRKQTMVIKAEKGRGINEEFGISRKINYTSKMNEIPLYSTAKYTQHLGITYYGEESEIEYVCVCIYTHA